MTRYLLATWDVAFLSCNNVDRLPIVDWREIHRRETIRACVRKRHVFHRCDASDWVCSSVATAFSVATDCTRYRGSRYRHSVEKIGQQATITVRSAANDQCVLSRFGNRDADLFKVQ